MTFFQPLEQNELDLLISKSLSNYKINEVIQQDGSAIFEIEFRDKTIKDGYSISTGPGSQTKTDIFRYIRHKAHAILPQKMHLKFRNCLFGRIATYHEMPKLTITGGSSIQSLDIRHDHSQSIYICDSTIEQLTIKGATDNQCKIGVQRSYIYSVKLRGKFNERLFFTDCIFSGATRGEKRSFDFSNTSFAEGIDFSNSYFFKVPYFFESQIHADTNFSGCHFYDVYSNDAASAYATLKQKMSEKHADHQSALFHALELSARRNNLLKTTITIDTAAEWLLSSFLYFFNNYGQSLFRPAVLIFSITVFFYVLINAGGGYQCLSYDDTAKISWFESACSNPTLYQTVRGMMGPFGLALSNDHILPANLMVKYTSFVHLLLMSLSWFIWILQIRARFKM